MDESLTQSITVVVGSILDINQSLKSNKDQITKLRDEIRNLEKINLQLGRDLDRQKQLLEYTMETGEDPIAASLQWNMQELEQQAKQAQKQREVNYNFKPFDYVDQEIKAQYNLYTSILNPKI